ncbi:MAG: 4Fe-4S binding protein [Spirochaetes bacterium]|nr:4Fe-4S binding protein [Spirochaetota bacterium]
MKIGNKILIVLFIILVIANIIYADTNKEIKTENIDEFIEIKNDEFKDISDDDFKTVTENSIQAEEKNSFIKMIVDNNIIILIIGIILGFLSFILKLKKIRYLFLLSSLIFLGFYIGGCNCSVGAVMKFFYYLIYEHDKLLITSLLILIPVVSTIFFGRIFCGYVCPIGALQEFAAIRDKLIKIDPKTEKVLKILRIFLIVFLIIISIIKHDLIYSKIFPFKTIFNLNGNLIQIIIAVLILIISMFVYRPFCRFLCPLAIVLETAGRFSIVKIKKDKLSCGTCNLCQKKCLMNSIDKNCSIDNGTCIRCGECTTCFKNK